MVYRLVVCLQPPCRVNRFFFNSNVSTTFPKLGASVLGFLCIFIRRYLRTNILKLHAQLGRKAQLKTLAAR